MNEPARSDASALAPRVPHHESIHRRASSIGAVRVVVGIALLIGSVPLLCYFVLAITSRCGFVSQWHALTGTIPLVPIPTGTTRLSDRTANGQPIQGVGGTTQLLYGELYHTSALPDTVVAFYQQYGATCRQSGADVSTYWHCEVDATESGWGSVDIFSQPAYRIAAEETRVDSYHVTGPLPHEGTIIRTFVNWCDDL